MQPKRQHQQRDKLTYKGKKKTHLQREKMKAKQKQAPASAKTWIKNVPEKKMKLTSEHTLSALKTERNCYFLFT